MLVEVFAPRLRPCEYSGLVNFQTYDAERLQLRWFGCAAVSKPRPSRPNNIERNPPAMSIEPAKLADQPP